MTILIAHRGNVDGPNKERENSPSYLREALDKGFHVECDIRHTSDGFFLGHDFPEHAIDDQGFLFRSGVWVHAKDWDTFFAMRNLRVPIYFFQEDEPYSVVSNGEIWANIHKARPGVILVDLPGEYVNTNNVKGFCSDYVGRIKCELHS